MLELMLYKIWMVAVVAGVILMRRRVWREEDCSQFIYISAAAITLLSSLLP